MRRIPGISLCAEFLVHGFAQMARLLPGGSAL